MSAYQTKQLAPTKITKHKLNVFTNPNKLPDAVIPDQLSTGIPELEELKENFQAHWT